MQLFTNSEKREFIDKHVAYRLTVLLSVIRRQKHDANFFTDRKDVYCASMEGAFIMLRVFIEFLGVQSKREGDKVFLIPRSRQKNKNQKLTRETDVMVDRFGLPLVNPADFGSEDLLIARVHDGLSKATAHFTFRTNHFFQANKDFVPAVEKVYEMLDRHFFTPLGEQPKFYPDLPR